MEDIPIDPGRETKEAHPQQLQPTAAIYHLKTLLHSRDPREWKIEDVQTPGSSDGSSVVLSTFVDYAATTLRTNMSDCERFSLAQLLRATDQKRILSLFQDRLQAHEFVEAALDQHTKIQPIQEDQLCPVVTPGLLPVEGLKDRMSDPTLFRSEQILIIRHFLECFYPHSAPQIMEIINRTDAQTLHQFIVMPGELAREMRSRKRQMSFAPPRWFRLSIHPDTKIKASPKPRPGTRTTVENNEAQILLPDLTSKLLGTVQELLESPFAVQKLEILSAIPRIYAD